ncbi:cardiolipin synthase [Niallia sp. XMNu-256]|uniref:cardiolipin synthase n=1 Tax=Niallia sp. XMNu-256 TaxID=3082444 RepID=UPI0030D4313B
MIIILLLLLLLTVWTSLDFIFGRRLHIKQLNVRTYPVRESYINPFTSGPKLFQDYFNELKKAEKHIHVLFYILKDDEISLEFMSILKEKAKEGVEVRLLLDWLGCLKPRRHIKKQFENTGVQLAFSRVPKFPFLFYSFNTRNHRKITVIDGKVGYLGGYNVGKEYINHDKKLNPWRDYHLKIQGEGVQDLQDVFLMDWQSAAKVSIHYHDPYFPPLEKGPYRHQLIPSEGFHLEKTFTKLIRQAEQSILIGTPYFIPGKKVFSELEAALKRGVNLEILVPGTADHPLVKEASYPYLRKLIPQGATIFQYKKGFYHAKILIIDDKVCDIGTANFDKRSFYLNHEINCYTYDKKYIEEVLKILKKDQKNAHVMTQKDLYPLSPWALCKEYTARAVSLFL